MAGLMSDNDVQGSFRALLRICESDPWRDVWQDLYVHIYSFDDFGLTDRATDAEIWEICQSEEVVLVTGNRNADDPTSLEATISNRNHEHCLPVLTLADAERIGRDRPYAEAVAQRLLEVLIDLDALRGAGRIYLP